MTATSNSPTTSTAPATATSEAVLPISQRYAVIDVDSHVTEPADLWTSRMSSKWGDLVPHVGWDERLQADRWYVGDRRLPVVGASSYAGWKEFPPSPPPTLADVDPASFDPRHRVRRLDEYGVAKQLMYPNILGFYSHVFAELPDRRVAGEIVRAYNDFQTWFSAEGDGRFVALTCLPYWDIDASVSEMERCAEAGHRGLILGLDYPRVGVPSLRDDYWTPVLSGAESLGLPINFHIGFAASSKEEMNKHQKIEDRRNYCKETALFMLGNANAICEVIVSGLCRKYPRLNFVSVESGAGFIPFLLKSLDWQWLNSGAHREYPDWLMPSDYFRRQIFGTFWFERGDVDEVLAQYPDNIMFETDFPHPTSLSPGPNSYSPNPKDIIDNDLAHLPEDVLEKVLHGTAARIYNLRG
jgi:predicted TIM-barrel fold metal-dependent hydrolase